MLGKCGWEPGNLEVCEADEGDDAVVCQTEALQLHETAQAVRLLKCVARQVEHPARTCFTTLRCAYHPDRQIL